MRSSFARSLLPLAVATCVFAPVRAGDVLFDATRHEMAGNADWVVDADSWDETMPAYPCTGSTNESNPGRFPTPPQSGVTGATPETYWKGGISAWAIELAKAGLSVETLPAGGLITFGDGSNPQDLSHYKLFIVVEPQGPFSPAEKSAILAFVDAGGGLFMVGDHETSDRDCDGWDAPAVWNDLTGATSPSSTGVFGIWMRVNGLSDKGGEDWFDDGVDSNVATDPADPIIHGPFGTGTGGLGLFGSTSMDVNPADNPTVQAHVWRTGQTHDNLRATFATAAYGGGRVAAIGDSSPADDGTGDTGDSLYGGWDKAAGGVSNREIHLNACAWLLHPAPDLTPPAITAGPAVAPADCSSVITWTTDEAATSRVDYGVTASYGSTSSVQGFVQSHGVTVSPLTPSTSYNYSVSSTDQSGNGPTSSADATFTTNAAAPPAITSGPTAVALTGTSATITWTTDEGSTSEVRYGLTPSYGYTASATGFTALHSVALTGLTPSTTYHLSALSTDVCGNGPTASPDATFATAPAAIDISGWTLRQYNSAQTYVIPSGTTIPNAGYLVVGRSATPAEFAAYFPGMPAGTAYLDSNANGSCGSAGCFPQINGGESFELFNAGSLSVDGATVSMSSTHSAYQRTSPGDPAGSASSWNVVGQSLANPGAGAGSASGAGLRINEMSDASDYTKEFVELYYDAGGVPDTIPPAAVTDLVATPIASSSIRLTWTATGDDGTTGTAASSDFRYSTRRIQGNSDFAAATPIAGVPSPHTAGTPEQLTVNGLSEDTAYYFAMKVSDEIPNDSALSNNAAGVTAQSGASAPVSHLVISQLQTGGTTDDVVELYNPTGSPISLSGHSVQYLAANGNFGFRVNLTGGNSVPAHGWYLAAANGYAGAPTRDDSMGTNNMSGTGGHALLVSKTSNVTGCSDAAIVDKVGYGASAICPEGGSGKSTAVPGAGLAVTRKPGGTPGNGQDSDVNSDDFSAPATSAFRNKLSSPATPPPILGNVKATLMLSKGASGEMLEWANAAGATGYRVYRGATADFMAGSPSPWQTATTNSTIDATPPSPILFYIVKATDGTNESAE